MIAEFFGLTTDGLTLRLLAVTSLMQAGLLGWFGHRIKRLEGRA